MSIETVIEGEVKTVETKVETIAEAVVAKVEEKIKAAIVEIKAEEQLVLRTLELDFLKLQMELQRLSKLAEEKSKAYQTTVEGLFSTYIISKAEYVFDGVTNTFKKL